MATDECCAKRQKYWSELNVDEKIERMRREVRYLKNKVNEIRQLMREMLKHQHGDNGEVLSPIGMSENRGECYPKDNDDVYF